MPADGKASVMGRDHAIRDDAVVSVSKLSKTYASGFKALERHRPRHPARGDLRAARPQRRRQDHADQHRLRHRDRDRGDGARRRSRHRPATIAPRAPRSAWCRRSSPPTPSRACWATVTFSRGLFGKPPNPALVEKILKDLIALGQEGHQDHRPLGRHEAARDDRQGSVSRAGDPLSRRAHGGRRRRASPRDVGDGARPQDQGRDHHPDDPLHRRGRGDGRPDRRHRQGPADPRRG